MSEQEIKPVRRIISFVYTDYSNFQAVRKEVTSQQDTNKLFSLDTFIDGLANNGTIPRDCKIYITLFVEIPLP